MTVWKYVALTTSPIKSDGQLVFFLIKERLKYI